MRTKVYYPLNLDLQGRKCLLVGGGIVAGRKAAALLSFGANVSVISPELGRVISAYVKGGKIRHIKRKYWKGSLKGFFLVIAATSDPVVNALVARHAAARNMLVNVVDVPALCNFIVPAVLRQGPLVIGISTSGNSPMVAQQVRKQIKNLIGMHYGILIRMLGAARKEIQARHLSMAKRKAVYRRVLNSTVLRLIEQGKMQQAKKMLDELIQRK